MVYNLYSILDVNLGFSVPMAQENDAVAMRSFEHGCSDKSSLWHTHCSDFSLHCVGTFDTNTGEISPCPSRKVCSAFDFVGVTKGVVIDD